MCHPRSRYQPWSPTAASASAPLACSCAGLVCRWRCARARDSPSAHMTARVMVHPFPQKIALFMNSSQVSGSGQLAQSVRLTFRDGLLSPYRVVGPASLVAWFLQYSIMGFAFQFFDNALSKLLHVRRVPREPNPSLPPSPHPRPTAMPRRALAATRRPVYYGAELMTPPAPPSEPSMPPAAVATTVLKTALSPLLAGSLESFVANRAEVQRYYGPERLAQIEAKLGWGHVARACGPAYAANVSRNVIMCSTTFVLTPVTYKHFFPQAPPPDDTAARPPYGPAASRPRHAARHRRRATAAPPPPRVGRSKSRARPSFGTA